MIEQQYHVIKNILNFLWSNNDCPAYTCHIGETEKFLKKVVEITKDVNDKIHQNNDLLIPRDFNYVLRYSSIYTFLNNNRYSLKYVKDVSGIEVIKPPNITLRYGGDCEDLSIIVACLFLQAFCTFSISFLLLFRNDQAFHIMNKMNLYNKEDLGHCCFADAVFSMKKKNGLQQNLYSNKEKMFQDIQKLYNCDKIIETEAIKSLYI